MSAPEVRTADGTVWTRRTVTRGGLALYALEGVGQCPEFVMATEMELTDDESVTRPLPAADAVCGSCGHDGVEHHHVGTACWAHMPRGRRADGTADPVSLCSCRGFVDRFTQLMAPVLALREDPHDSPLHHTYRLGRDLPAQTTTPNGDPR